MERRDIVIGLVILALVFAIVYFVKRPKVTPLQIPTPTAQQNLEDKFNVQIPSNADRAELKDVSGGNSSAVAAKTFENGVFNLTILADLPEPSSGKFYQGFITDGTKTVSIGSLRIAKGGYVVDYSSKTDFSSFKKVIISLQTKLGSSPEKSVLEGSF